MSLGPILHLHWQGLYPIVPSLSDLIFQDIVFSDPLRFDQYDVHIICDAHVSQ